MNSSNLSILEIISENHANDGNAKEKKKYNQLLARLPFNQNK